MSKGCNEGKVNRIIKHWFESGKSLKDCIVIVEPDIKLEVLEKNFKLIHKEGRCIDDGKAS